MKRDFLSHSVLSLLNIFIDVLPEASFPPLNSAKSILKSDTDPGNTQKTLNKEPGREVSRNAGEVSNWDNAVSRGINGAGVRDLGSVSNWPYDLVRPMLLSWAVHGIWEEHSSYGTSPRLQVLASLASAH